MYIDAYLATQSGGAKVRRIDVIGSLTQFNNFRSVLQFMIDFYAEVMDVVQGQT